MAADVVGFAVDTLWHAGGADHDPLAALVFCQPQPVDWAIINGRRLVQEGAPLHVDIPQLVERHNRAAVALVQRAGAR
jgi:8-oxoguanine deaminase